MTKENKVGKRRRDILNLLALVPMLSITELAEKLEVTTETIRNDLKSDSLHDKVIQSHGSVALAHSTGGIGIPYSFRKAVNIESKKKIAQFASKLVRVGQVVVFEHSTMGFLTAIYMLKDKALTQSITIVTNSFSILKYILEKKINVKVIFLGGQVNLDQESTSSLTTINEIKKIKADLSFLSPGAVDREFNVLAFKEIDAFFQKEVLSNCKENILLLDSSKYPERAIRYVDKIDVFDKVITDINFNMTEKEYLKNNSIEIIQAN